LILQITDGCRQLTLDKVFSGFNKISVSDVQYYESLNGDYKKEDIAGMRNERKIYYRLKVPLGILWKGWKTRD